MLRPSENHYTVQFLYTFLHFSLIQSFPLSVCVPLHNRYAVFGSDVLPPPGTYLLSLVPRSAPKPPVAGMGPFEAKVLAL